MAEGIEFYDFNLFLAYSNFHKKCR